MGLLWIAVPAPAAEWTITPSMSVRETYSDNITLSATNPRHDWVTAVRPAVRLSGTGRRAQVDLIYGVNLQHYARGTRGTRIGNRLQGSSRAELWKNLLFLDLNASVRQENVTAVGATADDSIAVTGTQTDVFTWSASPYLRHRFGSFASGELRYLVGRTGTGGAAGGGETTALTGSLSSGTRFARTPWTVTVSEREEQNRIGTTNTFRRANGTVRYIFSRRYAALFGLGYEDNDFATVQRGSQSSMTWRTGLTWTPTPRTSVEGGLQERANGRSFFFDARHRARRSVFSASYNEEFTTTSRILFERQLVALVDEFGEPILDPDTGALFLIPLDLPTLSDEVINRKRLQGAVSTRGLRTSGGLRVFHDRREFEQSGGQERTLGFSANASHSLSSLSSVRVAGSWQRSRGLTGVAQERLTLSAAYSRRFADGLNGSLDFRHTRQTSEAANNEFDENRISLLVRKVF